MKPEQNPKQSPSRDPMMPRDTQAKDRGEGEAVPPALERQINENLRRLYQEALDEEVPDRLQQLLERLREQDKTG